MSSSRCDIDIVFPDADVLSIKVLDCLHTLENNPITDTGLTQQGLINQFCNAAQQHQLLNESQQFYSVSYVSQLISGGNILMSLVHSLRASFVIDFFNSTENHGI